MPEEKFMFISIFQRFYENWKLFLPIVIEKNIVKEEIIFFFWIKKGFKTENREVLGQIKPCFSF